MGSDGTRKATGMTGKSEHDDSEREFDLRWARDAPYKEPSARARMLAARWKENPPEPVPFRGEPEAGRGRADRRGYRRPWSSAASAAIILLLGYAQFRAPY